MRKSFDEGAVKVEKAYHSPYFCDVFGCWPPIDSCNFYGVHACHPLFKDYPQVIHGGHMEEALLWFEIEVVLFCNLENVSYCGNVVRHVGTCGNTNIVHVYTNHGASEFVSKNDITINIIHHGLESGQQVCKANIHYCGFE